METTLLAQIILAILNIVLIIISGKAAAGITKLRGAFAAFKKSVGEPDPNESSPRTGPTLIAKVENLQRDQEHLVETVGNILVQFQRQQREFFADVIEQLPTTGKRINNGE